MHVCVCIYVCLSVFIYLCLFRLWFCTGISIIYAGPETQLLSHSKQLSKKLILDHE